MNEILNIPKLDSYIEMVIRDAYKSEGRKYVDGDVEWYYLVVKNQFLFYIKTPYSRVSRKVEYRVLGNIGKNFGFTPNGDYYITTTLDVNSVCNRFTVGGLEYYLNNIEYFETMPKGMVFPCKRYEDLCIAYHGVSLEEFKVSHDNLLLPSNLSWRDYLELYLRAFNESPEVGIEYKSKNVIL